jgi:hypothetical protein
LHAGSIDHGRRIQLHAYRAWFENDAAVVKRLRAVKQGGVVTGAVHRRSR